MLVLRILRRAGCYLRRGIRGGLSGNQGSTLAALQFADPQAWPDYPIDILDFSGLGAAGDHCISSIYHDGRGVPMQPSRGKGRASLIAHR